MLNPPPPLAWILIALLAVFGPRAAEAGEPMQRVTLGTAQVEPVGSQRVDVHVGNTDLTCLGLSVSPTFGLPYHVQMSTNVAHLALGIPNAAFRWRFYHTRRVSLALDVRALLLRPAWIYAMDLADPDLRELVSGVSVGMVPLKLYATFDPHPMLTASLILGYDHASAWGNLAHEGVLAAGALGARRLWFRPVVHVHATRRVSVMFATTVPVYASALASARAEVDVEPGIVGGGRTLLWQRLPVGRTASALAAVEVQIGRGHVVAGVSTFGLLRDLGVPVIPMIGGSFWL